MTTFDQSLHPRGHGGKFTTKQRAEPAELETPETFPTYSRAEDTTDDLGGPDLGLIHPAPRASIFAGANPNRQSVGLPGHCESCAQHGHVAAHPDFGCGDVGCDQNHDEIVPEVSPFVDAVIDNEMARADQALDEIVRLQREISRRSLTAAALMVRSLDPSAKTATLTEEEGMWRIETDGAVEFDEFWNDVWHVTRMLTTRERNYEDTDGVELDLRYRDGVESITIDIDKVLART